MEAILERLREGLAGRYEIEQELGEGGMAFVFLARDVKHDRQVAVKVLRPELTAALGAERFLREIQVTAKLSHPHILPLYDSGEADGLLFYVMPYIIGESLADYIDRERQLQIDEAARICREVAEALAHAHSYGLVHRDIKPDNIMLSGGHAIVADFGIALAVTEAGNGQKLTQTGMAVGTPAYMAPEQAAGDPNTDGRADIYSLGCVLYELLVGEVPFTGPTPQSVIARHTMDQLTAPHIMRQAIPEELEDVIYCAMAKQPVDRFRTAAKFAEALKTIEMGGVPKVRKSTMYQATVPGRGPRRNWPGLVAAGVAVAAAAVGITVWAPWEGGGPSVEGAYDLRRLAVLYFDDRSPDGELQYLADGVTEGLIAELSRVQGLEVVSRNGVAEYRGTEVSLDSIARALEAGTLVVGSISPRGQDRIRLTAEIVDGESGVSRHGGGFEAAVDEVIELRDSLAGEVAVLLRDWLGDEVRLRNLQTGTNSAAALTLLQRAEKTRKDALTSLRDDDGAGAMAEFTRADSLLALAEEADRDWAEPVVLRGTIAYTLARLEGPGAGEALTDTAIVYADRALEIEPRMPRALELRGRARFYRWLVSHRDDDRLLAQARDDLLDAVEGDPALADAHNALSIVYTYSGDKTSAAVSARRAWEADAYLESAADIIYRAYNAMYNLDQIREARVWCDRGVRRFPSDYRFIDCQLFLMATEDPGPQDVDRAWELANRLGEAPAPGFQELNGRIGRMVVGGVLGLAGMPDSARAVLLAARGDRTIDPELDLAWYEAYSRTLLGDHGEAIDLLKRWLSAHPEQDHGLESEGELHWWWRPLRNHPRYRELSTGS